MCVCARARACVRVRVSARGGRPMDSPPLSPRGGGATFRGGGEGGSRAQEQQQQRDPEHERHQQQRRRQWEDEDHEGRETRWQQRQEERGSDGEGAPARSRHVRPSQLSGRRQRPQLAARFAESGALALAACFAFYAAHMHRAVRVAGGGTGCASALLAAQPLAASADIVEIRVMPSALHGLADLRAHLGGGGGGSGARRVAAAMTTLTDALSPLTQWRTLFSGGDGAGRRSERARHESRSGRGRTGGSEALLEAAAVEAWEGADPSDVDAPAVIIDSLANAWHELGLERSALGGGAEEGAPLSSLPRAGASSTVLPQPDFGAVNARNAAALRERVPAGLEWLARGDESVDAALHAFDEVYVYAASRGYFQLSVSAKEKHGIETVVAGLPSDLACWGGTIAEAAMEALSGYESALFVALLAVRGAEGDLFSHTSWLMHSLGEGGAAQEIHGLVAALGIQGGWARTAEWLANRAVLVLTALYVLVGTALAVGITLRETQSRILRLAVATRDAGSVRSAPPPVPRVSPALVRALGEERAQARAREQARHSHTLMRSRLMRSCISHGIESLVFVPLMLGTLLFLHEFFARDQVLAFLVLTLTWLAEYVRA